MRQIGQAVGPWHQKQCLWPRGRQVRFSETGAAGHAVSCSKLCMAARLSAAVGRTACCDIMCDCRCAQVSRISTEAALDVLCACPTWPSRGRLSGGCHADDTGGRANGTWLFGRSTTCLDSVRALDWQRGLVRCAAHCLCPADLCSGLRAAVMLRCGWRLPKRLWRQN